MNGDTSKATQDVAPVNSAFGFNNDEIRYVLTSVVNKIKNSLAGTRVFEDEMAQKNTSFPHIITPHGNVNLIVCFYNSCTITEMLLETVPRINKVALNYMKVVL